VGAERLRQWSIELEENWQSVRFGDIRHKQVDGGYRFDVQVFAGDLDPEAIRVELYAEPNGTGPERIVMHRQSPIPGAINAYCYVAEVPPTRPPEHYTVRLVGGAEGAHVPLEDSHVRWQR
jgi:starch phosphorylase